MNKVPTTDDEAKKAFRRQRIHWARRQKVNAVYEHYRKSGMSVLDAYMATLQKHVEIAKKAHSE